LAACSGKHFPDALLIVRKAGDKPIEYLKIKMTEVLITSVTTGGSGGEDRLTENVTLNFAKVKVEYTPQKDDGSADATLNMGWDIAANVKA
jgi:type VI secretion system secreted protein Hcp